MLTTFKTLIANQYEASFCMLNACIDRCPDSAWNAPVANLAFCQAVFHALFYADYYLGNTGASFCEQPFHRAKAQFFRDYEEFEDRKPELLYDKRAIKVYLQHSRDKAREVIAAETAESLAARPDFERIKFSRAELLVYNMRHIQHHAAQLSLRLRLDFGLDIPWIGTGWRDV